MSLRDAFFFAGARFRAAAGAVAAVLIDFFARGFFVTRATAPPAAPIAAAPSPSARSSTLLRRSAFAGLARFAAVVDFAFFFVAIYQCTVTLSPLRPSSR